jgi:hypothetical protein
VQNATRWIGERAVRTSLVGELPEPLSSSKVFVSV